MNNDRKKSGLVYSTDGGTMCPVCRRPISQCRCGKKVVSTFDCVAKVTRETRGRNGKAVTVVKGLALDAVALELVGKKLKIGCGSGGTVKDGVIEVQGDHRERVVEILRDQGLKVKLAGG